MGFPSMKSGNKDMKKQAGTTTLKQKRKKKTGVNSLSAQFQSAQSLRS